LVSPTDCIGHGACQAACPVGAIDLVFGTEKRGIDIPAVGPNFETNVPGIYIAGELGGMGLIRNAIEQGRQAMENIEQSLAKHKDPDVLVVGAGPAGIAASLGAMEKGLKCITIEQESLGGTVAHFPRGKLVMTAPAKLPLIGTMRFREVSKEALLKYWQDVMQQTGLRIRFNERVESIQQQA
jgi:thioredoxin reductase (NADPH)